MKFSNDAIRVCSRVLSIRCQYADVHYRWDSFRLFIHEDWCAGRARTRGDCALFDLVICSLRDNPNTLYLDLHMSSRNCFSAGVRVKGPAMCAAPAVVGFWRAKRVSSTVRTQGVVPGVRTPHYAACIAVRFLAQGRHVQLVRTLIPRTPLPGDFP